jgi:hypothetical protein
MRYSPLPFYIFPATPNHNIIHSLPNFVPLANVSKF